MGEGKAATPEWLATLKAYYDRIIGWVGYELREDPLLFQKRLDIAHSFIIHIAFKEARLKKALDPGAYLKGAKKHFISNYRKRSEDRYFVEFMETKEEFLKKGLPSKRLQFFARSPHSQQRPQRDTQDLEANP